MDMVCRLKPGLKPNGRPRLRHPGRTILSRGRGTTQRKGLGPLASARQDNVTRLKSGRSSPTGSRVPGDSGWDFFRLRSKDVGTFNRFREVEVIHARWAMLGVVSLLVGDLAGSPLPWSTPEGSNIISSSSQLAVLLPWGALLFAVLALLETYRLAATWGETDTDKRVYPGGKQFDPLGLTRPREPEAAPPGLAILAPWVGGLAGWLLGGWWWQKPELTEQEYFNLKSSELRNGRLAMVSFLGVCFASLVTGKGPITLLMEHLADPLHHTIVQTLQQ